MRTCHRQRLHYKVFAEPKPACLNSHSLLHLIRNCAMIEKDFADLIPVAAFVALDWAEDRRRLVEDRTRLTNALKSRLKQYFPLALEVLGELDTELACQFLLQWGSLEELQQEKPEAVAAFYRLWKCHHPQLIEERVAKIAAATPLVTDPAILHSGRMMV